MTRAVLSHPDEHTDDLPHEDAAEALAAVDTGYAPPVWEFDSEVTRVFDDMLERSIPGYGEMRRLVTEVGLIELADWDAVVDLGCSRGGALAPFVERHPMGQLFGYEVSPPMVEAARARYADEPRVTIDKWDLRYGFPPVPVIPGLVLCVLTLQFVPVTFRHRILLGARNRLRKGGRLILVEKILGSDAIVESNLVDLYHLHKNRSGYSWAEIEAKRAALENVLVPLTAGWNEQLLRAAGFETVEPFWRNLNFCAWVATA